jgi:hypothetical protein
MAKSKRPIYFQLSGRLGNQLFQLAYAHKLAQQFDRKILLITDSIHFPSTPGFDLVSAEYNCDHVLKPRQINAIGHLVRFLDKLNASKLAPYAKTLTPYFGIHRQLDSHRAVAEIRGVPWLFTGFYINAEIVERNEFLLYDEITNLLENICRDSEVLGKIKNLGEFQMMHVRRGDYLNNIADFGILSPSYYLSQRNELPLVLALENIEDLDNLQQELKPTLILTKENSSAWETLSAMSQASDIVMSNSTFSWWGGFLATNNGGIARLPSPYFKRNSNVDKFFKYRLFSEVESDFVNARI